MAVKTTNKNPNNNFQSNKKRDNNNKKATSTSSSSIISSPPPLDKWIKPLAGIAIALLVYQFLKGMVQSDISRIDLEDELELRKVFFGEVLTSEENHNNVPSPQNYAVLCHPETATYPISSVFEEAAKDGSAPAIFRVIDCHTVMAGSDKTVLERFQLNDKTRPLVFVSGKQGPPKQVQYNTFFRGDKVDDEKQRPIETHPFNIYCFCLLCIMLMQYYYQYRSQPNI